MERRWQHFWRYLRRYSYRLAVWLVRVFLVATGVVVLSWMLAHEPQGWALVALVAAYGIYAITEAMKRLPTPVSITQIKPDVMDIREGTFSLASDDLDRAVGRLIASKANGEFHPTHKE